MVRATAYLACALAAAPAMVAGDKPAVTRANFNALLAEHAVTLVAFTAPWCGHCKKLKPELASAEPQLAADDVGVLEVDATKERELAREFDVRGFPDLFIHRRDLGVFNRFAGKRSAQGIVQYMRRRIGDACHALKHEEQISDFLDVGSDLEKPRVRLYAEPADPPDPAEPAAAPTVLTRDAIERAVERVRDQIPCAMPPYTPGSAEYAARVRLASTFEGALDYTGPPNATALWRWIQLRSRPTVGELTERTVRMYVGERETGVAIAMLPKPLAGRDEVQRAYYEKELRELAIATRDLDGPNVFITHCRADSEVGQQLVDDYKLDALTPSLLLLDFTRRARKPPGYAMPGTFELKPAVAHLAAFKAGELRTPEGLVTRLLAQFEELLVWVAEHTLEAGVALVLTVAAVLVLNHCLAAPAPRRRDDGGVSAGAPGAADGSGGVEDDEGEDKVEEDEGDDDEDSEDYSATQEANGAASAK